MSDNSTGSSGSSSNSWTLLSPEEAAVDTAGPVDDGTESIGDAPSLSEEVAGSALDVKLSESETPVETILSEEGHQVCQETSPEFLDDGAASGLAIAEVDPEICAPVIHDTITSSPPDNDLLGAVPFTIATESALFLSEEQEAFPDVQPTFELPPRETLAPEPPSEPASAYEPLEINLSSETPDSPLPSISASISPVSDFSCTSVSPVIDVHAEVIPPPESSHPSLLSEADFGSVAESPPPQGLYAETVTASVSEEEELEIQREEPELQEKSIDVLREPETIGADVSVDHPEEGDDGLRLRHVHHTEVRRHSSDEEEEEEEEEEEFKLPERKEEKSGFSLNHLIIGALALLCLGSLLFSDFEGLELSDQEILEKLAQENQQISILEAQIQSQKEELDKALKMAADKRMTDNENAKMKEELSALPALKDELEALRARVTELTQLTAEEPSETSPSSVPSSLGVPKDSQGPAGPNGWRDKEQELNRQKILLEESRNRLEGIKKHGWDKKGLRESLVKMQQRLSEQADNLGKRDAWKRKQKEHKEGKKEWSEKKRNQWKMEEMEKKREWKINKDQHNGDWKHKEHFKKYREEWDQMKDERKLERERRKQERPWQTKPDHHHHHKNNNHKQHQKPHEEVDFWKHQDEKLRRNQHHPEHCHNVAECADAEGLIPVEVSEFQALLQIYLNKLDGIAEEDFEFLRHLVAQFFRDGIFSHDSMLFSEFAEDVADILEDLADVLKEKQQGVDDDALEEEMEKFEREALWKFAAPVA